MECSDNYNKNYYANEQIFPNFNFVQQKLEGQSFFFFDFMFLFIFETITYT